MSLSKIVILITSLVTLPTALANCAYGTHLFPRQANTVPIAKFSYDDLNGPLNWYSLNSTANTMCAKGTHQTPIVLDSRTPLASTTGWSLTMTDYPTGAEFENLGSTVEVIANGTLTVGAKTFNLAQYHFHTPSEHRINDEYFPMEVHFVFKSAAGELTVFGVPIELCTTTGCTDQFLAASLVNVGKIATPGTITTTGPLKFGPLISSMRATSFYTYSGSLTTPPCSEGVNWFVSSKTLPIDAATFLKVKKVVKFNARYTQDVPGSINLLQNNAQSLGAPRA